MKKFLITAAIAIVLSASTQAIHQNVLGTGDFPANDISSVTGNNGLGEANLLAWLQAIASQNQFPAPTTGISAYTSGDPLIAGDYLVLHYGVGNGGTQGSGGGLVALYFGADLPGGYTVPQDGSGPNGLGGLSFARLFDHTDGGGGPGGNLPDGGATAALLGLGALALGAARKASK